MTGAGTGHEMDPDTVRSGAGKFPPAGDDLKAAGAALKAALEAQGACWGNDESGQAFAKDYEPAAKNCTEAFGSLSQALKDVAKAVKDAADATEGTHKDAEKVIKNTGQV
ncbi:WXG100 family type VII secretion target [Amycolatopsis methanolica]|uniref:WXG100 family type VII secretion target n=1 Tax=Amycolatopsis methanolica 239 TaxID=1068978 RepID=A0A076N2V1_AMYME|nr:hypothetical protein [Amycolatopsis methanolica]AIJ27138.1 hypothetical protein AMETH_7046 [Amycolatopsis methanolica 239]